MACLFEETPDQHTDVVVKCDVANCFVTRVINGDAWKLSLDSPMSKCQEPSTPSYPKE